MSWTVWKHLRVRFEGQALGKAVCAAGAAHGPAAGQHPDGRPDRRRKPSARTGS
jgi:hypothetical protein